MSENWNNGLFDQVCGGDCGTCLAAWWCSPCLFGRTDQRLKKYPDTNKDNFSGCNSGCWIFCGAGCFSVHWLVTLLKRGELRERFGIKGDAFNDCLISCCCTPCALAQMETEIKDRATRAQSGGLREVKQGEYAPPQQGMQYQPQAVEYQPHGMQYQQQPGTQYQQQPGTQYPQQPQY